MCHPASFRFAIIFCQDTYLNSHFSLVTKFPTHSLNIPLRSYETRCLKIFIQLSTFFHHPRQNSNLTPSLKKVLLFEKILFVEAFIKSFEKFEDAITIFVSIVYLSISYCLGSWK